MWKIFLLETIVALGDSVTLGVRRDGSVTEAQTFVALLGKTAGRRVINAGIGGNNTDQMLSRLTRDALSHRPDTVIIMAGLNDAAYVDSGPVARTWPRVSAERFESNLTRMVREVKAAGARPVLATPNPMTTRYPYSNMGFYMGNGINHALELYRTAVLEVASAESVCVADVYGMMQALPDWERLLPDGIHPNPEGHQLIASLIQEKCLK